MPGFPATCPFVTAVGGTVQIPEIAASLSGGGFSDYVGSAHFISLETDLH